MRTKSQFILNVNEFKRLCFEHGWDFTEAANNLDVTREYVWRLTIPANQKGHSAPGPKFRKNALKVFGVPAKQLFFMPTELQARNSSAELETHNETQTTKN